MSEHCVKLTWVPHCYEDDDVISNLFFTHLERSMDKERWREEKRRDDDNWPIASGCMQEHGNGTFKPLRYREQHDEMETKLQDHT